MEWSLLHQRLSGKVEKGKKNWSHLESFTMMWLEIKKPLEEHQWNSHKQTHENIVMNNKRKKTFHSTEAGFKVNFQIFIKIFLPVLWFYDENTIFIFLNRHKRRPQYKQWTTLMNGKITQLERCHYSKNNFYISCNFNQNISRVRVRV